MTEELDPYEEELKKEKQKENDRINEDYQEEKYGNEEIRKIREGEGTRDYRERIYPQYKKNRRKNQQRVPLLPDADIQAQGDAKLNPSAEDLKELTPEQIEANRKGVEEAKKKIGENKEYERDNDGFLKLIGQGLTVFGNAMESVDKAVLGRIGLGDKNLYTARRGIIDGLGERHIALALLGEFLLPDTLDLATLGLSYIPKRFLKSPKLLRMWAKMTKKATAADEATDAYAFARLGGRPRLANRIDATDMPDNVDAMWAAIDANKARELTTPERQRQKILAGKGDLFDLNAAVMGKGVEGLSLIHI